jgi:seryl-tRNA synthetase
MHDIKWIRANPDAFDAALAKRGLPPKAAELIAIDADRRAKITRVQELQAERNAVAQQIGAKKKAGEDASDVMARAAEIKAQMEQLQGALESQDELQDALCTIPNLPAEDVPQGADEHANKEIRRWGEPKEITGAKEHDGIGEALGQMDFESAATLSGARFVVLKKDLARMERALANFMLDLHTQEFGYTEVVPPFMVRDAALYGTGQLPKFGEDLFKTTSDHWLIPTAEVPLTNLVNDKILAAEELPLRLTAYTPCFRSEAGSAGKDTRGMIRQHQFTKVELVSITTPDKSDAEHERMTMCAEEVLKRLELPFRTLLLCTGDMGFSARKTYDLEVWLPGQKRYREISSVSNCGDFQARRMKARYRAAGEKETQFAHTLNGSGLAVGRTLVAVLENYQNADGTVTIPAVLRGYMNGKEKIGA